MTNIQIPIAPPPPDLLGGGGGDVIVNVTPAEAPPPGPGLITVTDAAPAPDTSEEGTVAARDVAELNVVASEAPFHWIVEELTKPLPFTVIVKPAEPACTEFGDSDDMIGTGLATVKVAPAEVPPPGIGFTTVKVCTPAATNIDAGRDICNCVAETKVALMGAPSKVTSLLVTNPVPVSVMVVPLAPTKTCAGARVVSVGVGL